MRSQHQFTLGATSALVTVPPNSSLQARLSSNHVGVAQYIAAKFT
jgi:hypothetical protein